jgi:DNA-directed RNA polymerase III subunit RPC2
MPPRFHTCVCKQVQPAPGPEEVNWESLWFNHSQRRLRQFMTTPFAILVVFAPVSLLTSAISSLNSQFCTAVKFEFYCESKSAVSNIIRGLVTGFLPSLLIILWQVRWVKRGRLCVRGGGSV